MGWGFHRVVVINRRSRPERLAKFLASWDQTRLAMMPIEVFTAVEGPDPTKACMESHLRVLAGGSEPVLILEDDAVFGPDFPWEHDPPPDWAVLWLGAQHMSLPRPATRGWVEPVEIMRTHAYVARHPSSVGAMFRFADPPRLDPYLARLGLRHYVADPQTVGQDGGPSDTGEPARSEPNFWHLGG